MGEESLLDSLSTSFWSNKILVGEWISVGTVRAVSLSREVGRAAERSGSLGGQGSAY